MAVTGQSAGGFYIDGTWTNPSDRPIIAVIQPAKEAPIGTIAARAAVVDRAVAAARRAFPAFAALPVAARRAMLVRIAELMEARAEDFAQALSREMGAAIGFARTSHVPFAVAHVRAEGAGRGAVATMRSAAIAPLSIHTA